MHSRLPSAPTTDVERDAARGLSTGVAMCTCNAGAFIHEQLESIVNQTVVPDQIVISDDRSDDHTWTVLQSWAQAMQAQSRIRITLLRNDPRLGVTRNFEQAIRLLDTDIIFLADQDDIWTAGKVEALLACFAADPELLLAHSDAELIDEQGHDLGKSLFAALRLSEREQMLVTQDRFFEVYCRRNLVTGTTAAFRRELLDVALPFAEDWVHDEWLAACAASEGKVSMLADKLTQYRQHRTNVIGIPVSTASRLMSYAIRVARTPRIDHLHYKLRRLQALRDRILTTNPAAADKLALVDEAIAHYARRIGFARSPVSRLTSILHEYKARGYHRFADGFAGMVRDVIHL
ncbi:glycosyltransferase family 2 protein [Cupriavidus necator]|uniref:glycosyltransferase family 2 protein n=1 Tax=Cupriavidus necator TaxID=106590 RepID=UPI00278A8212|nr:glycosyltransferase family 2 protein [Cupriavidus necator]MDQ0141589.1 glycosyltransferase involved in cell wall biosynthesis [Cupriavidus necator]